jgi:hypothetical protein
MRDRQGSLSARKEAPLVMHSSGLAPLRAFLLLVCTVGVPLIALSGTSWSEIVRKFHDCHLPTISDFAIASPDRSETPPATPPTADAADVRSLTADAMADSPNLNIASAQFRDIQERLREWGATYYVLESWGNDQPLYRFYCKMAVGKSDDYVHCFEATHADPFQAMVQVLRQVEAWRQAMHVAAK